VFTFLSRFIIDKMYFAPIYPLFILNILAFLIFLARNLKNQKIVSVSKIVFSTLIVLLIASNFYVSLPVAYSRFNFKEETIYKVYQYIEEEIPDGSKIAYDHFVAIPENKIIESCHYWRGCGTDYIEEFDPDFVMFNMDWKFGGGINPSTQRLMDYVEDHNMVLVEIIGEKPNAQVWVWKKPELPNNQEIELIREGFQNGSQHLLLVIPQDIF
jgi:hypothetical protein